MFAVFEHGGKQYKAKVGDVVKVEKINNSEKELKEFVFESILLVCNDKNETILGTPYVKDASVVAKILDVIKDKKVLIFKKKRRHNYRRKMGHRQTLTVVKVSAIKLNTSLKREKLSDGNKSKTVEKKIDKNVGEKNGS